MEIEGERAVTEPKHETIGSKSNPERTVVESLDDKTALLYLQSRGVEFGRITRLADKLEVDGSARQEMMMAMTMMEVQEKPREEEVSEHTEKVTSPTSSEARSTAEDRQRHKRRRGGDDQKSQELKSRYELTDKEHFHNDHDGVQLSSGFIIQLTEESIDESDGCHDQQQVEDKGLATPRGSTDAIYTNETKALKLGADPVPTRDVDCYPSDDDGLSDSFHDEDIKEEVEGEAELLPSSPSAPGPALPAPALPAASPLHGGRRRRHSRPSIRMVVARAVGGEQAPVLEGSPLQDSDEILQEEIQRLKKKRRIQLGTCLLLSIVVTVVLSVVLSQRRGRVVLLTTLSPTSSPTLPPEKRAEKLTEIVSMLSPLSLLNTTGTPQNLALSWLIDELVVSPDIDSTERIQQRYSLAVLYFATGGNTTWQSSTLEPTSSSSLSTLEGFLSPIDECAWQVGVESCDDEGFVTSIVLTNNGLSGSLPTEIFSLIRLSAIVLNENQLSGTIPSLIGKLTNLSIVEFYGNSLDGTIPSELWSLRRIKSVNLGSNFLTGSLLSTIGDLTNLADLVLERNRLGFTLPPELFRLRQLRSLVLRNNVFSGSIPSDVGAMKSMELLQAQSNLIAGVLPTEFGDLTKLTSLHLNDLYVTGTLPSELGRLNKLKRLHVSKNLGLNGTVPLEFLGLTSLQRLTMQLTNIVGDVEFLCESLDRLDIMRVDLQAVNCTCCDCC